MDWIQREDPASKIKISLNRWFLLFKSFMRIRTNSRFMDSFNNIGIVLLDKSILLNSFVSCFRAIIYTLKDTTPNKETKEQRTYSQVSGSFFVHYLVLIIVDVLCRLFVFDFNVNYLLE